MVEALFEFLDHRTPTFVFGSVTFLHLLHGHLYLHTTVVFCFLGDDVSNENYSTKLPLLFFEIFSVKVNTILLVSHPVFKVLIPFSYSFEYTLRKAIEAAISMNNTAKCQVISSFIKKEFQLLGSTGKHRILKISTRL